MTLPLYGLMVPSGSVKLCSIYFPLSEGIDSGVADSEASIDQEYSINFKRFSQSNWESK